MWSDGKPNDIIDIANEMCRGHPEKMEKYPIDTETLIALLYVLFRWMYKMKWTDHKLIKRSKHNLVEKVKQ